VIFKEDRVGGRARVTVDEERVLRHVHGMSNVGTCPCTH